VPVKVQLATLTGRLRFSEGAVASGLVLTQVASVNSSCNCTKFMAVLLHFIFLSAHKYFGVCSHSVTFIREKFVFTDSRSQFLSRTVSFYTSLVTVSFYTPSATGFFKDTFSLYAFNQTFFLHTFGYGFFQGLFPTPCLTVSLKDGFFLRTFSYSFFQGQFPFTHPRSQFLSITVSLYTPSVTVSFKDGFLY
jgi:hypothetical protein